jgi:hypothetical protein
MLNRYAFRPERLKPAPPKKAPEIELRWVFQAACWMWGAYSAYSRRLAQDEESLLRAAKEHFGWLRQADVLEAVRFSQSRAQEALARLKASGQMIEVKDLYIFPAFLPATLHCEHCDSMWLAGETQSCHNCGAPLHALEGSQPQ